MKGNNRLENAWQILGTVQNYLAEARVILGIHERSASGFQLKNFADCIQEAAFCSERLTGELRKLVLEYSGGGSELEAYGKSIIKIHEVLVTYVDGILRTELPFLLPHRKHPYTDYLYYPLLRAFENWCERRILDKKEIPYFEQATVCFVHMYDKKLSLGRIRDHDNIEVKQVVDALGMFFLVSDGGLSLDIYHTTVFGERNRTFLFLMEKRRFVHWILAQEQVDMVSKKEESSGSPKSTG